ncbi:retrovirus-related pol polyprotein from transposon TNT 1-94 [Tanacetum coccineum]
MLLMQAQENRVVLDEEQLLFITSADDYDAFDSDIYEAPTAQTMFMENLSSADPVYDEASPSYDSDILSEYVKDNAVPVVQSNVSSVPNDAYMMIINEMHEQATQCVSANEQNKVVNASLTAELARYKEQVELIVITDRNIKEENLKKELHSVKLQLNSTINHNKSMVEEVTSLKKDFKQKENKYLEEFLDMKALKEKVEDRLFKQDQSLQLFYVIKPNLIMMNIGRKFDEIEQKNLLIANDNLITDCLTKEVFYIAMNSELTISRLTEMHDAHTIEQNELFRAENAKIKQHYKELYNSIKIMRAKHIEQTTTLLTKNENLKVQIKDKMKCVTMDSVKPKVLAPGINTCIDASESQPRSNTKNNRISPAKSNNKKKVEEHPRTNKSSQKKSNRVNSSIISKRAVINLNSHSVCKTFKKVWKPKQVKQVWKATGKLLTNVSYQWKPSRRKFTLGEQCPLTRLTKSRVVLAKQTENIRTSKIVIIEKLSHTSQKPLIRYQRRNKQYKAVPASISTPTKNQEIDASMRSAVVQIVLWYLDSGCSKHMTGNRSWLRNLVQKFIGTVRFGNDHFGAIMGYGDYVIGDSVIFRVYYVEGLGHNLFSVGQFCDSDLEVAFTKHSCYVRDTDDVELIKGSRGLNLYTISIKDMMKSSPICLLSKATINKSWLWHRRLNHLNFGTINDLARKDLVRVLPRLNFEKDHLCSDCQLGKSKKHTYKPKVENTIMEVLHTLHMDLCGPMRVQSINGKKYILVIVDDFSRFTWVKFLRSKDETPEFVTKFLTQIQVGLTKLLDSSALIMAQNLLIKF